MYNRYVPAPDGSHQKRRMPEPAQEACCEPSRCPDRQSSATPGGFLRNLIPSSLDAGDLVVLLLLLLIAGDSEQEKNHALLTAALYFIL